MLAWPSLLQLRWAAARARARGLTFVVAAGNYASDACEEVLVQQIPHAVVVGALSASSTPTRALFSNFGRCVSVWARGVGVVGASDESDTSLTSFVGTSAAAPQVAGVVAVTATTQPQTRTVAEDARVDLRCSSLASAKAQDACEASPHLVLL